MNNQHIGSSLDDWLREEGIIDEVTAVAVECVLARQIAAQMEPQAPSESQRRTFGIKVAD